MEVYTIGHSNHTWERFAALLRQHGIEVLLDVRTNPVSRWAHFASKRTLPGLLEGEGMRYVHMGDSLGGKLAPSTGSGQAPSTGSPTSRGEGGESPELYDSKGKPDYEKMRSSAGFQQGIEELLKLARDSRVAIMCAEEDPTRCHRTLLIGPQVRQHNMGLRHIRKDGSLEDLE